MSCNLCKTKPVIILHSGARLCKSCFSRYFEGKAKKTIRKYDMFCYEKEKKRNRPIKIGVAISGGKDSLTALKIINDIATRQRYLDIIAILIDEGIKGYRNITIKDAKRFCRRYKIGLHIVSFKKEFGYTLDEMVKKLKDESPCTICGVLRRHLLNKTARELGAIRLVTGHNLDDEAQAVIMNQFRRNIETSARLGPITGIIPHPGFIRRIKPLYFLTEKETTTYAYLKKFVGRFVECPYSRFAWRSDIRDMLNDFEAKYPGTKYSIISSFLEILPLLKKSYKEKGKIRRCKLCKEPCTLEVCKACDILGGLKATSD